MAAGILKTERLFSQLTGLSEGLVRLFNKLLRILTFSPFDEDLLYKKSLVLSIERGVISAAYGSRLLSKIRVKAIRTFRYEDDRFPSPEDFASTASILLGQIKERPEVDLVIPKSWVILKVAEFPITVKENLRNVISFEMDRLTPFNPEEVFFDYKVIKEDGGRLFLLIAAAKKDTILPYIEALQGKGISVRRITIGLSAMANLSYYSGKGGYTIFFDVGRKSFESGLFDGPLPVDYVYGDFETDDVRSKVEKIMDELQNFSERIRPSSRLPEVLLLLRDNSIRETLKAGMNYPLKILGETDIKIKLSDTKDIPYVALGGLIESLSRDRGIDLLSSGIREKKKVPVLFTTILVIAVVLLSLVYFITPLRIEERRLHAIEEQIAQKKAEARKVELLKKEVEDLRDEITSINNFKEGRTSSLSILKEMTLILPKNAWLTRFRITETNVDIEGYAGSATELLPKLEASRYFRKAEFSSPTFRDARMNADRFIIKMEIETARPEVKIEKK